MRQFPDVVSFHGFHTDVFDPGLRRLGKASTRLSVQEHQLSPMSKTQFKCLWSLVTPTVVLNVGSSNPRSCILGLRVCNHIGFEIVTSRLACFMQQQSWFMQLSSLELIHL